MELGKGMDLFVAPIKTEHDAVKTIGELAKGWYALAGIIAVSGLLLFYLGVGNLYFIVDTFLFLTAGYFLPERKSRTFAVALFLYAVVITGLTFAVWAGLYEGSGKKNIVLALVMLWMAYRGMKATFVYHSTVKSQIVWKHVAIVLVIGAVATVFMVYLTFGVIGFIEGARGITITEDQFGAYLFTSLAATWCVCFIFLSMRFPCVTLPKPSATS